MQTNKSKNSGAERHINLRFTHMGDVFPFLELTWENRKSRQGMNPAGSHLDQLFYSPTNNSYLQ